MRDGLGRIDSVAVVGGRSAIGKAIACRLVAERGATTLLLAGRDMRVEDGAEFERLGACVQRVEIDVAEVTSHARAVQEIFRSGTVDAVVLAAGVLGDQSSAESDPSSAVETMLTDYVGPAHLALHLAGALRAQGTGVLIVISSVAAVQARRSNFVYGSAKAGLDTFAQGMSDMLEGTGARAVVVRPGFVRSPMTEGLPEAPFAQSPDQVAAAVLRAFDGTRAVVYTSVPVALLGRLLQVLPRRLVRRLPEAGR